MSAMGQYRTCAVQNSMSVLPLKATVKADIRNGSCLLYPESGHVQRTRERRLWARSGHQRHYLIKSSARPISVFGTLTPSDLAVFRLITSSTLLACCTGRSAGLSPLRTRPV
jgi:hypothetical protein